jgi:biopolymer transport protein ExbB
VIDILQKGGFLMYPIFFCSVLSLAVIIERLMQIRRATKDAERFVRSVHMAIVRRDLSDAVRRCEEHKAILSSIILAGLSRVSKGEAAVRQAIEEAGARETQRLEKHIPILQTIVGGAPLLGFLGTVFGMIQAFQQIERLGGDVDASVLAGGIWQALLTTAAGLTVSIPTFFAHNFIVGRIRNVVTTMEESSERITETLFEGGPRP